jgi:hypothetical protein
MYSTRRKWPDNEIKADNFIVGSGIPVCDRVRTSVAKKWRAPLAPRDQGRAPSRGLASIFVGISAHESKGVRGERERPLWRWQPETGEEQSSSLGPRSPLP